MRTWYPLLAVGAVIGLISAAFILAYAMIKDKKEEIGFDRHMKDGEIIRRLLKYAKPYRKQYALIFFLMVVSLGYDIVPPLIIGNIEDVIRGAFEMSDIVWKIVGYFIIVLLAMASMYGQRIMLQRIGQKILSSIREDVFTHIESFSHDQLNHIPVGKLVTRTTNDTNAISMLFTNILINLLRDILLIAGVLIAMFSLNIGLTLMVLCFSPFIVLFTMIFRAFSRRAFRKVKDGTTDINTFLSENLSGIKITQIFNNEEKKLQEFRQKNETLKKAKNRQIFVFAIFRPIIYMLYISSVMVLFYLGARGYIEDTAFLGQVITSSIVVSFYIYIETFFRPIQNIAELFNWMQSAFASAEKDFGILDRKPEIVDEPDAVEAERIEGRIEFKNVWFAYEDENWILKDVSFTIEPKQTVAFVGATGAGKTTILGLVCRNYDIQKGQILIDGKDIKSYKIRSLRRHFGQMLQDVFLFEGTIRSNIVLREESFTDEEVMEACRYVNADKFIDKLPKGLDEEVRERGNNFSAGQRQLMSFARTVIHKPDVMILDEATANIDTETELLIQDSLEKMMNIGTMLIVAHRLSTIQHADNIIVINHGQVVEQGTHFELLEKQGAYYELYKLQYEDQEKTAQNA
ncbi:MAG: ABC transporter ATP-binding protein [Lachnospiraceae bacterium]|nr:ABC transporter ATP-binding protein [Lachnospiraceae bacterium]